MAVVALGRFNRLEYALVRGVQVGFLLLALGTVVEDGVDLVVGQGCHCFFAFGNGLASAEVAVDCRANGPAHRDAQGQCELHQCLSDAHQPDVAHGLKQDQRPRQFPL